VFPHPEGQPSLGLKAADSVLVAGTVSFDLVPPPLRVRPRPRPMLRASVPEAAINEDCYASLREHHVGTSTHVEQRRSIHSEPQAHAMEVDLSELGCCVSRLRGFHPAARIVGGRRGNSSPSRGPLSQVCASMNETTIATEGARRGHTQVSH
jgi:hypothetical protein